MYRWMLKNNIEIYEYQPNILHAKIATCDGKWLTAGSYNVNNISAYASIELNLEIENPGFVRNTEERLEHILNRDCKQITHQDIKKVSLLARFLQRSAYDIFRLLLFLFTFYFKEQK
jgi:cardiolipin synthase A/B